MTVRQFQARASSGMVVRVQRNVFRMAGAPVTWEQSVLAACMSAGTGAGASHRCAAVLWGLRGIDRAPVEITVPASRCPTLSEVVVHRLTVVDLTAQRGIPLTTPAATLLGLAAVVDAATLESAVEDAIRRRLTTVRRLTEMLADLGRPGRDGSAALRRTIEKRGPGSAATESLLEDRMVRLLRQAGLPPPVRQHRVGDVRLDFAYPEKRLGIEVNGVAFHSGAADVQRNCAKGNVLVARGWRVLQFTWTDVTSRPERVLREIAEIAQAA